MKTALQLYTVRDRCKTGKNLLDTLKEVKKIGYDGVEFAGYSGLDAREIRAVLTETGLEAVATHESLDRLENSLEEVLSTSKVLECKNIVCAYAPTENEEDLAHLKKVLLTAEARAKKFRNHGFIP